MNGLNDPTGKKVKLFLANNFVFRGECIGIEEGFLILSDDKTGKVMLFPASSIISIEVMDR